MNNMSYCRFSNTLADLIDCLEALDDIDGAFAELSESEGRAAAKLIAVCQEVVASYGENDE